MHVHDDVAQLEELLGGECFCEEICQVIGRVYILYLNDMILDELADEEMSSVNVFGSIVELRVVGEVYCSCVVYMHFSCSLLGKAKFVCKFSVKLRLFCCF